MLGLASFGHHLIYIMSAANESVGGQGVELCPEEWQARLGPDRKGPTVPHCGHGPLLLFERFYEGSPPAKFWVG